MIKDSVGDAASYGCSHSPTKALNMDRDLFYSNEAAFAPFSLSYLKYRDAASIWIVKC